MRMRRRNNLAPRMEACESVWIHEPEALRGNWRSLMPGCRELRVEVGCGKGKFTVETAEAEPDVLLIAIERVQDALVLAMEAAIRKGLKNVFFVSLDAANIDQFFADDEIDLLYINFCDPWPRNKNAKRRLTYHTFLEKYKKVLKLGGQIPLVGLARAAHQQRVHMGLLHKADYRFYYVVGAQHHHACAVLVAYAEQVFQRVGLALVAQQLSALAGHVQHRELVALPAQLGALQYQAFTCLLSGDTYGYMHCAHTRSQSITKPPCEITRSISPGCMEGSGLEASQ